MAQVENSLSPVLSLTGNHKKTLWWCLVLLFLLSRVAFILWGYEEIYHPEEKQLGYIALDFLTSPRVALVSYQVDTYTGGSLFLGLLAIPFILTFGTSLLSLKMLALALAVFTFGTVIFWMKRFFGEKAAFYAALLWVFSPPVVSLTSLMLLGSHERLLPAMLFLYLFYAAKRQEGRARMLRVCAAGLAGGWAFSFSYINLIAIAAAFFAALFTRPLTGRGEGAKSFFFFGAGFLAGASLWISYNVIHQFAGFEFIKYSVHLNPLQGFTFADTLKKTYRFIVDVFGWGASLRPVPGFPAQIQNFLYLTTLSALFLYDLLRSHRVPQPDPVFFFRVYPFFFAIAYVISIHEVSLHSPDPVAWKCRYFKPLFAFLILYAAVILSRLRFGKHGLILLLLLGLGSQISAIWNRPYGEVMNQLAFQSGLRFYVWRHPAQLPFRTPDQAKRYFANLSEKDFRSRGRELKQIANQASFWDLGSPPVMASVIGEISNEKFRRYFIRRWPTAAQIDYTDTEALERMKRILPAIPSNYVKDFIYGAGQSFMLGNADDLKDITAYIEASELPHRELLYLTWGSYFFREIRDTVSAVEAKCGKLAFIHRLPEAERTWFYRGIGTGIYRSFRTEEVLASNLQFLTAFCFQGAKEDLYWGIGWYLGRRYFFRPERARGIISKFDPSLQASALEGFSSYLSLPSVEISPSLSGGR